MQARIHAGADGGQGRGLGEDLRVRADADFEILAPGALGHQNVLEVHGLCGAGLERLEIVADERGGPRRGSPPRRPASPRARSSITRSSIETAKVTPAALMTCRSIGARSQGFEASRAVGRRVARAMSSSEPILSPCAAFDRPRRIVHGGEFADRGACATRCRRDHPPDRDHGRPHARTPDAPDERPWNPSTGRMLGHVR